MFAGSQEVRVLSGEGFCAGCGLCWCSAAGNPCLFECSPSADRELSYLELVLTPQL